MRLTVLLLLLLNLGYYAWNEGWLGAYGLAPTSQREPERLAQQVNPKALTISPEQDTAGAAGPMSSASHPSATASVPVATGCLQSNELDADSAEVLRPLVQSRFQPDAWRFDVVLDAPRWMVYMGKFSAPADLTQKRAELNALKIKFETVSVAELSPGLSLGLFASQTAAKDALGSLTKRGVRTAKVLQLPGAPANYRLRLSVSDPTLPAIQALGAALPALVLSNCN